MRFFNDKSVKFQIFVVWPGGKVAQNSKPHKLYLSMLVTSVCWNMPEYVIRWNSIIFNL